MWTSIHHTLTQHTHTQRSYCYFYWLLFCVTALTAFLFVVSLSHLILRSQQLEVGMKPLANEAEGATYVLI